MGWVEEMHGKACLSAHEMTIVNSFRALIASEKAFQRKRRARRIQIILFAASLSFAPAVWLLHGLCAPMSMCALNRQIAEIFSPHQ
jgi:hypothetical protein